MNFQTFLDKYEKEPVELYPTKAPKQPLVSVCVQTYNHAAYIRQCLDGILMQETDFDIEILLGEDNSTDTTRAICIEYAEKYPEKIRLFLHKRSNNIRVNNAPTGRFNFMHNVYQSRGQFIALCEGDDYWLSKTKLQEQIDLLRANKDCALCFHDAKVYREENKSTRAYCPPNQMKDRYTLVDTFGECFMPTASILFRKHKKDYTFPSWFTLVASSDMALFSLIAATGDILYLDKQYSLYRKHSGGVSTTHGGTRLLRTRMHLFESLNVYFDYKYDKEIMAASQDVLKTYRERDLVYESAVVADLLDKLPFRTITAAIARRIKNKSGF